MWGVKQILLIVAVVVGQSVLAADKISGYVDSPTYKKQGYDTKKLQKIVSPRFSSVNFAAYFSLNAAGFDVHNNLSRFLFNTGTLLLRTRTN